MTMRMFLLSLLLPVLLFSSLAVGQSVEIRLEDGSRWRGEVGQNVAVVFREQGIDIELVGTLRRAEPLFLVVRGLIAGELREKTIFRADVIAMRTVQEVVEEPQRREPVRRGDVREVAPRATGDDVPRDPAGRELGVFVLPLEGMVGGPFRHQEIKELGEYVDRNYGPGQIIVIIIDSNGGLVVESKAINRTIADLKQRHRVVAWVRKAVSAGCSTAMACDEIYFMTEGYAGSVTTVMGIVSVPEEQIVEDIDEFARMAEENGYSAHIARAMKLNKYMVSYDKDEMTGEVTFYGDLRGKYILSDDKSNLSFNASNALHSGFSKGTADTPEELAKLLDLPKWHEISDYGRVIAQRWLETTRRADREIPRLIARLDYAGTGGDQLEFLGRRLNTLEQLLRWTDRAPLHVGLMYGVTREAVEPMIEDTRRSIAALRRR
jgi:hypothetical protein